MAGGSLTPASLFDMIAQNPQMMPFAANYSGALRDTMPFAPGGYGLYDAVSNAAGRTLNQMGYGAAGGSRGPGTTGGGGGGGMRSRGSNSGEVSVNNYNPQVDLAKRQTETKNDLNIRSMQDAYGRTEKVKDRDLALDTRKKEGTIDAALADEEMRKRLLAIQGFLGHVFGGSNNFATQTENQSGSQDQIVNVAGRPFRIPARSQQTTQTRRNLLPSDYASLINGLMV